jgi:hypothetical protein
VETGPDPSTGEPLLRRAFVTLALVLCAPGLTACGDGDSSSGSGEGPGTKTIDITIQGTDVTPNGDRLDVQVGQPIELVVKADAAGAIHVHSDPEQELEYAEGTTTLEPFTIDKPGLVEVESHALEKTIVQLRVE